MILYGSFVNVSDFNFLTHIVEYAKMINGSKQQYNGLYMKLIEDLFNKNQMNETQL